MKVKKKSLMHQKTQKIYHSRTYLEIDFSKIKI